MIRIFMMWWNKLKFIFIKLCINLEYGFCLRYLTGNPCTEYEGYREYVIATLPHLKVLTQDTRGGPLLKNCPHHFIFKNKYKALCWGMLLYM